MCKVMEDYAKKYAKDYAKEQVEEKIINAVRQGVDVETIVKIFGVSSDEVEKLKSRV